MVSLRKEECLRLRKVVKWTYRCTLASGEAVSFTLLGELLFLGGTKSEQEGEKVGEGEEKERRKKKEGRHDLL